MNIKTDLTSRAGRLVICAMLLLAWTAPAPRFVHADIAPTAPLTVSIDRMFSAIKNVASDLPRDSFDPQAAIDQAGREPRKLFDWVRQNTSWAAYDGQLRGASGVLMDRTGNSLDRALLLADLLGRCGYKTRLAHAGLSATQAAELLKAAHDSWHPPTPVAASRPDFAKLAERTGLPADLLERTWRSKQVGANEAAEDALQRVSEQTPVLTTLMTAAAKTALATQIADELRAITEHYWVQYESAANWIDLDLAANDGKAIAKIADTLAPDNIPAAMRHTLRIRVVIEQWSGGRLAEHELMASDLNLAAISGQRVALLHSPLKFPTDTDVSAGDDPLAAVRAAMIAQKDWVPVLQIGASTIVGKSFNDAGDVSDRPSGNPAASLGAGGVGAFGGFGGGLGGGEDEKKYLTAEWIEYVIHVPGHGDSTIRREIFDLVGPAVRAGRAVAEPAIDDAKRVTIAGALLGSTEILAVASQPTEAFVADLLARSTLARQPLMTRLAAGQTVDPNDVSKEQPPSGQLYGLALARRGWARHADTFLDRINVFAFHTGLRSGADGTLLMCEGFDIVENGVGVRPGADPLAARLEQGVLDTNAEAILSESCGQVRNTGQLMTATPAEGWTLIHSPQDPPWKAARISDDLRARVNQDLSRGMMVAISLQGDETQPTCWWRIDPTTGQTLGIGDRGWGQTTVEKAIYNARLMLNWFDVFYCTYSSMHSHASNNAKGIMLLACMAKTSAKGASLLLKGPQAFGFGVVLDLFTDAAGGLAINAVKLFS